jgi:CRISPR/Cas system CMR-associated protein Cmr5 small subunit
VSVRRVDQGMAAAAARVVPPEVGPELRTRYRQLRAMLHTAGLAATYAFIAAKASEAEGDELGKAYRDVAAAIRDRLNGQGFLPGDATSHRDVLAALGTLGAADYARASAEVVSFVGWLSRLGDALCRERGGDA